MPNNELLILIIVEWILIQILKVEVRLILKAQVMRVGSRLCFLKLLDLVVAVVG